MQQDHYDVLILGAGLSGIGMACHLARECPDKRFAVLERRQAIGGTWDLFRYPGIRSDSDMFSFGYGFRPWNELKVLADGPSIRRYVADTAREYGVEQHVQFGLKVTRADWSSEQSRWFIAVIDEATGQERRYQAPVVICCTGYYNYDQGFLPHFPGEEDFKGLRIHPQHWPEALDYRGKRVVVIGSGATAVTLVPAMSDKAAHVTMLQRSPSYIFNVPGYDKISAFLGHFLPQRWVYELGRRRNIFIQRTLYKAAKRWPKLVGKWLLSGVRKKLPADYDMSHFTPRYKPWDERLCAVPDGDLFAAIKSGKASVVTDHIERFTAGGIRLKSGKELPADIIVTATGLQVQLFGGIDVRLDGQPGDASKLMTYKATLVQGVPNLAFILGYTNAPWTLKADIASRYVCRVLKHMDATGTKVFTAHAPEGEMQADNILDSLGSGYVQRAKQLLPRQGRDLPWRVLHNYERDLPMLIEQPIDDGLLRFSSRPAQTGERRAPMAAAA